MTATELVLADGTIVGNVTFWCNSYTLYVGIDTNLGDHILLESTVDAVNYLNCDRPDNGLNAYITPSGNPIIGTGDASSRITSKRNAGVNNHSPHTLNISGFSLGLFCVTLTATLVDTVDKGKSTTGYLDGIPFPHPNSPHAFVDGDLSTTNG